MYIKCKLFLGSFLEECFLEEGTFLKSGAYYTVALFY